MGAHQVVGEVEVLLQVDQHLEQDSAVHLDRGICRRRLYVEGESVKLSKVSLSHFPAAIAFTLIRNHGGHSSATIFRCRPFRLPSVFDLDGSNGFVHVHGRSHKIIVADRATITFITFSIAAKK